MRLLALCGFLALVSQPCVCERRNYAVCSTDPGFECEEGKACMFPDGGTVGMCVSPSCGLNLPVCPSAQPLCVNGSCSPCTADAQCLAINKGAAPFCQAGHCIACRSDKSDCSDPVKPICDATTQTCRPCTLHSDCSSTSGVCAKDDSFASLTSAIPKGSCVDPTRVVVVDDVTCPAGCTLNSRLALVSTAQPYLKIVSHSSTAKVTVPPLPAGLPTYYIIGPTADLSPAKIASPLKLSLSNSTGVALSISAGAHTIFEGAVILYANPVGLDCAAAGTQTKVTLLRSFLSGNITAIQSSPKCELTIDSSWIGKGPQPQLTSFGTSNGVIMQLDSTRLVLTNSVLWKNGSINAFGGIKLNFTAPPVPLTRIINTTFATQTPPMAGAPASAIDCSGTVAGITLVNTLFANASPPTSPTAYVQASCLTNGSIASVASNDPALTCPTCVTDVSDSVLVSPTTGDLHYVSTAPASVATAGVTSITDAAGAVPIPTTDIEGKPRATNQISLGAFEAAH